jgi:hypothetical protein
VDSWDTWSLWWDNVMLWAGTMPDQDARRDALLEFWWGQGADVANRGFARTRLVLARDDRCLMKEIQQAMIGFA